MKHDDGAFQVAERDGSALVLPPRASVGGFRPQALAARTLDLPDSATQARSLKFAAVCYWRASPAKERSFKSWDSPPALQERPACPPHGTKWTGSSIATRPPDEKRPSIPFLSGQFVNKHFSIEASAVRTPVRTTVSPMLFLTRIDAPSGLLIRKARASTSRQTDRSSESVSTPAKTAVSPFRTISKVKTDIQYSAILEAPSRSYGPKRAWRHLAVQHNVAGRQGSDLIL